MKISYATRTAVTLTQSILRNLIPRIIRGDKVAVLDPEQVTTMRVALKAGGSTNRKPRLAK